MKKTRCWNCRDGFMQKSEEAVFEFQETYKCDVCGAYSSRHTVDRMKHIDEHRAWRENQRTEKAN